MLSKFISIFKNKKKYGFFDIDPDEIFMDSKNLPEFDRHQFEGRMEKPISVNVLRFFSFFLLCIGFIFLYRLFGLQIISGEKYKIRSESNSLHKTQIFADRGIIFDRNGLPIVWNVSNQNNDDFSLRQYATSTGLSTILGYVKYPTKDGQGIYYQDKFDPKDGIEKLYNNVLSGIDGTKIIETDVKGNIVSQSISQSPQRGQDIELSIDLHIQKKFFSSIVDVAGRGGFKGGAGVLMDVNTGEIIASVSYPEYDSQVISLGKDKEKINNWLDSSNHPFLNRVVDALYTPGSIMKVFIAMGVLKENVISPEKKILSTGSITVPNPFFPDKPSVFMDWKEHGLVNFREAIALSSNVYFYEVGGGYRGQKGIGISNIEKYTRAFGFGTTTGISFPGELQGTIPNPEWKKANFNGEQWRLGDTYNTSIGQYGFQVSPIQVVRATGAIATEGKLVLPILIKNNYNLNSFKTVSEDFTSDQYKIVKEGMRLCVTFGTCGAINFPFVSVAGKTGTAQIGINKIEVNSWIIGFWPYNNPKYSFAVVMERGSKNNQFGAVLVMRELFDWMNIYAPKYLKL